MLDPNFPAIPRPWHLLFAVYCLLSLLGLVCQLEGPSGLGLSEELISLPYDLQGQLCCSRLRPSPLSRLTMPWAGWVHVSPLLLVLLNNNSLNSCADTAAEL